MSRSQPETASVHSAGVDDQPDAVTAGDSTSTGAHEPVSRRRFLLAGGATAVTAAAGAAGGWLGSTRATANTTSAANPNPGSNVVPFYGSQQAGIATPAQDRLHFAAFDVTPTATRADLTALLQRWTAAAAAMTSGSEVGSGAVSGAPSAPPDDTGEAMGLPASRLTLTVGFGPTLFTTADGKDRFGIAVHRPPQLADLPAFPGDALQPAVSGGDLCVQACADDPQVAVHAIRNLARLARGTASVRYSQLGFGRTSTTSTTQDTPRNMMGFKDGTANIRAEDTTAMNTHVWAQATDGADWMIGGSYLVSRRIRMLIEPWDSTSLTEQERVIGRRKGTGAPLTGLGEFDEPDLSSSSTGTSRGQVAIDVKAHIRLAHSSNNNGAKLLRRGYSFTDGTDNLGRLDAGLFFLAYQRDPRTQFVTIQRSLAGKFNDALNEYIRHVGSGLFACPPGIQPGQHWGQTLLT